MSGALARIAVAALCVAPASFGGARPRYGGSLRVAISGAQSAGPELGLPETAAMSELRFPAVCRLDPARGVLGLLADVSRPKPNRVAISPRGGLRAAAIAAQWGALFEPASPYRALLAPVRGEGRMLAQQISGDALELPLQFPWPDLDATLCHPALGLKGAWAYSDSAASGGYDANLSFSDGRPFPDVLKLSWGDDRKASRLFATGQADLLLGAGARDGANKADRAAPLFATYLAYRPARVGTSWRPVVDDAVDPRELTQRFVSAPAVAMSQLLPPPWMNEWPAAAPSDQKGDPAKELQLLYDSAVDEHRAIAERLQVRLHDRGFRIALKPLAAPELRARWAKGDYDAMLYTLLLPPAPAAALALVIELAGRHDLLAVEMSALGALSDAAERQAKAAERAKALRAMLPVVPLYARAPQWTASARVQGLSADAFGLLALDQLFLQAE